jgi:Domain of unknown function (DUF4406)
MRIYISGPMSGRPELNRPAFELAAKAIRRAGHQPVVPHDIEPADHHGPCTGRYLAGQTHRYGCYLLADLAGLAECDALYPLAGADESPGARVERAFAVALGIRILRTIPSTS